MKRKLIDYDVFKQIESKFLQTAEKELNEATDAIATALGKDNIALFGITESEATFATDQGTLVAVNIDATTYEVKKHIQDNAFFIELDMSYSFESKRQRQ